MNLEQVLRHWHLQVDCVQPPGKSNNLNYQITTSNGKRFLLRQHMNNHGLPMLESELIWLRYLHAQGLDVQQPILLPSGELICTDDDRYFSLLTWLEGETLQTLDDTQAEFIGALMGRLHVLARAFTTPSGFERPRYNMDFLERTLQSLGCITWLNPDLPLFEQAIIRAKPDFLEAQWSLIHADLHLQNLIWDGQKFSLIDFDLCGFGPSGYDIVTTLGYLESDQEPAFLRGYDHITSVPALFHTARTSYQIGEWLSNLAFLALRDQEREYLETSMLPELRKHLHRMP